MKESKEKLPKKGTTARKVKTLQKSYNKILVDLFDEHAAESIESALEGAEGAFGENISAIVQSALDNLRGKIFQELGVKSNDSVAVVDLNTPAIGDDMSIEIEPQDTDELPFSDDESEDENDDEENEEDSEENEESESEDEEVSEPEEGGSEDEEDEEEDKEEEVEEKVTGTANYLPTK